MNLRKGHPVQREKNTTLPNQLDDSIFLFYSISHLTVPSLSRSAHRNQSLRALFACRQPLTDFNFDSVCSPALQYSYRFRNEVAVRMRSAP
jgi:hypothetical protein